MTVAVSSVHETFTKFDHIWKFNSQVLNNLWGKEEITKEVQEYIDLNEK
jgi:hypothetical protein